MILKRTAAAVIAGLIALCASAQGVISVDTKSSVLPDGKVELLFTVNMEPGWYMYSTVPVSGGPMATTFTADAADTFSLEGSLQDVEEAHIKFDEGFAMEVKYFEGTARFRQVITPATADRFTVKGYLEFQTCNGAECTLNESEVSVKVDPGPLQDRHPQPHRHLETAPRARTEQQDRDSGASCS